MLGLTMFELAGYCEGESGACQTYMAATVGGDYYAVDEVDRMLAALVAEAKAWRHFEEARAEQGLAALDALDARNAAVAACDAIPALREALKP